MSACDVDTILSGLANLRFGKIELPTCFRRARTSATRRFLAIGASMSDATGPEPGSTRRCAPDTRWRSPANRRHCAPQCALVRSRGVERAAAAALPWEGPRLKSSICLPFFVSVGEYAVNLTRRLCPEPDFTLII